MSLACTFACKYSVCFCFYRNESDSTTVTLLFIHIDYYWNLYKLNRACCSIFTHQHLCLQGLAITVRYHLGTVAFGSSILAIIDTLRTVVDIIKDRLESVNLNNYGRCLFHSIDTCLRCVRSCFHFFSQYTYIMVEMFHVSFQIFV